MSIVSLSVVVCVKPLTLFNWLLIFFGDEKMTLASLGPILQQVLPGDSKWQEPTEGGTARIDGASAVGIFTYLVVEAKNKPGLDGDQI